MRFFIALEIPESNKKQLTDVQRTIKSLIPDIRLTDPDKLHLTLAFLGEQPDDLKDGIISAINKSVDKIPPFKITPSLIDGFPNIHHPHTLWAGVSGDTDKLHLIAERLKDNLKNLHLSIDKRRFVPHIALGKAKNLVITYALEEKLQQLPGQPIEPIIVSKIKLFESVPEGKFHKHNTLAVIKLTG